MNLMGRGRTIKWKGMECFLGQMAENTRANTKMTRKRVKEYSTGLTVESTMADGKTENIMELLFIPRQMANLSRATGKMERGCIGLKTEDL
jgi:hypothetical protein